MSDVIVVGSGPSGVHFARTLLERGVRVTLVDVGHPAPAPVAPELGLVELKEQLPDPAGYFLGAGLEGVVLPDDDSEFYGFPPGKEYIFRRPAGVEVESSGFDALFSYAQGGLAETWTAGCYPLNAAELSDFPFAVSALESAYDEVAQRIGVSGDVDDLSRFFPVHAHLQEPLPLDEHSERLLRAYGRKRERLNRMGCWVGRTRVATLSRAHAGRPACSRLGRCLWGCPTGALYTPSATLAECRRYESFTYRGGVRVDAIELDGRRPRALVGVELATGAPVRIPADRVALAAGALSSARIFLRSIQARDGRAPALGGLMDNRQVLVPFMSPAMLGKAYEPRTYQYHLLGMGLTAADPRHYVHCQITTLKTALLHPVAQQLPVGLASGLRIVNLLHAALGVVNVNFHDTRRPENRVRLGAIDGSGQPVLQIEYRPPTDEAERMERAVGRVRKALRALGCFAPRRQVHVRPMGASVHYGGLLPMTREEAPWTSRPDGRSRDIENLYLVDGIGFPFLPAKNGTFTLMANAVRIARDAFRD